jgi:hypothetical protein
MLGALTVVARGALVARQPPSRLSPPGTCWSCCALPGAPHSCRVRCAHGDPVPHRRSAGTRTLPRRCRTHLPRASRRCASLGSPWPRQRRRVARLTHTQPPIRRSLTERWDRPALGIVAVDRLGGLPGRTRDTSSRSSPDWRPGLRHSRVRPAWPARSRRVVRW